MRTFKLSALLICLTLSLITASCSTKGIPNTAIRYAFVCSEQLVEFVDVTATYEATNGDTEVTLLTAPAESRGFSYIDVDGFKPAKLFYWTSPQKNYDDVVDATVQITFSKKEGVDYSAYKDQSFIFTANAAIVVAQSSKDGHIINNSSSMILDYGEPVLVNGEDIEAFIDGLVKAPITKSTTDKQN